MDEILIMGGVSNSWVAIVVCLQLLLLDRHVRAVDECNQDILDRSFVTRCSPVLCEPVLEFKRDNDSEASSMGPIDWPSNKDEVVHIVSSRRGDRFVLHKYKAIDTGEFYYEESHVNGSMFANTSTKYQRILGFGTTLTDASCTNVDSLPEDIRTKLIADYFSVDAGLGINLIKVPIGSSKYSFSNYVLDQPDNGQVELSPYDIDHRIPLIKDAIKVAGRWMSRIKILASSASAPPEYKESNRMIHGNHLRQDRLQDYAKYLTGFINAYKDYGLNIWSLIVSESPVTIDKDGGQNETLDYNSMAMRPTQVVKLIRDLSAIRSRQTDSSAKFRLLLLGDDRAYIPVWADSVFQRAEIGKEVAGIAYTCNAPKVSPYDNLEYVTRRYPGKFLLTTQGSINAPVKLGNWQYAENYATEIVKNLAHGSVGWIDFNLALNLEGGPFISQKFKADASVMVDPKRSIYYRNPMYYAIGHLSRYVKPGSVRVRVDFYSSAHMFASQYIAFVTPDNHLVVFVMNNNIGPMPINLGYNARTKVEVMLDTKSFNTFIFKL